MAVENGRSDKREVVFEAAARLFMANGYMSTTMDDVAAAVSLNKGTLYYYYQGKASILFDIVYRLEEGRLAIARSKPFKKGAGSVAASLREFVEDTATYILDNPVSSRITVQESPFLDMWLNDEQLAQLRACHDEYHSFLVDMIEAGMAAGELMVGNASVMAQGITGALSWMPRWFRSRGPLSKSEVAAQLTEMLINGIVTGKKSRPPAPARAPKVQLQSADIADAPSGAKKRPQPRRREKASTRRARAAEINKELI
jgi:AcrR family transcriptional regulator